jgi:hypothetical protein
MATNPVLPVVAPNDLITSVQMNNVRANIDRLDVALGTKLPLTGGTLSAALAVGASPQAGPPYSPGVLLRPDGVAFGRVHAAGSASLVLVRAGVAAAVAQPFAQFMRGADSTDAGSNIGTITVASTTSVAYNTTSDPRTKTAPPATRGISDAADRARRLGAGAWQGQHVDPDTGEPEPGVWDFVSSHDVQDVAPYAVYGERDAVDPDTGAPIWQQVDYGSLVPLLFAALADALERIDALEAAA